jgi:hypothetical protein
MLITVFQLKLAIASPPIDPDFVREGLAAGLPGCRSVLAAIPVICRRISFARYSSQCGFLESRFWGS